MTPDFFHVFAKRSLTKNIFEEEKKFDSGTRFFWEYSSQLGVFWPRRGLHANQETVRKSAIFTQPNNQKQLKWSNTAYVNKWRFAFKIKLCVIRVTKTYLCMKVIRIFNAQPVKIPHFKSPLTYKQARWPPNFFQVFAKNSLIKNINEEEKKFDSRTWFFWKKVPYWM